MYPENQKKIFHDYQIASLLVQCYLSKVIVSTYSNSTLNKINLLCIHFLGVYVAEFAHPTIRANLNLITAFAIAVGQAMTLNLEYFLDYRQVSWILIVPPSLVMLMLFWLPESPFWLIKADKTEEAK